MKKSLQSLVMLLMALMVPVTATAAYEQLADGVYQDGSTLYITSSVTALGPLQVNPSVIYSFATVPPACMSNTFTGYGATLHMPSTSYGAYFVNEYWGNFASMYNDAVEPTGVVISNTNEAIELGDQLYLSATVTPSNATPSTVVWSTSDATVATVNNGVVTAKTVGECDIVATCIDKQAVCHVSVEDATVIITLDRHNAQLLPNHSLTITPTMTPVTTNLKVSSSNPNVAAARLVNGAVQVVGLAEGTTKIVVSSVDNQAVPDSCTVTVYTELGDVNCDGYVNISDVTNLIDFLLSNNTDNLSIENADIDKDNKVNISDVTSLIDYLLSGIWPWGVETFIVNGVEFKMISVEGGTFLMGATIEQGSYAEELEKPAHEVTLSSYSIGETEVTQELWQAVMGINPSYFTPTNGYDENLKRPVEMVFWNDCPVFIAKLNELTGKKFRLPTEAEWEYAARGGNKSQGYMYAGSNDINEVAWYINNSYNSNFSGPDFGTHTVATKAPNELGLYDMSGNVYEWCQDWYSEYSSDAQMNPTGFLTGDEYYGRVCRGGCWEMFSQYCRVSNRTFSSSSPGVTPYSLKGLRLALDKDDSSKFRFSETVVTVQVGESKSVNILNGNGNYIVEGGDNYVTSMISGNSLSVTGIDGGVSTVFVTDVSTGAKAALNVVVKFVTKTFTVNGVSFTMVPVEGGTFTMGATPEQGTDIFYSELPTHQVTLSSFSIGETEVTQELWQAVMGSNPSHFSPTSGYDENLQRPVENVSWNDCQTFISRLRNLTGKLFRLPTEAEWEYAARGGNKSQGYMYAGSNDIDSIAWYYDNADFNSHTVATKAPNELGLYDMSGNVFEWCQDWYSEYSSEPQTNPTGPLKGSYRVFRGGSFERAANVCRVSPRNNYKPTVYDSRVGLRLAMQIAY